MPGKRAEVEIPGWEWKSDASLDEFEAPFNGEEGFYEAPECNLLPRGKWLRSEPHPCLNGTVETYDINGEEKTFFLSAVNGELTPITVCPPSRRGKPKPQFKRVPEEQPSKKALRFFANNEESNPL